MKSEEFATFATQELRHLRRLAYAHTSNWADADDAVQETLIRLSKVSRRIEVHGSRAYARKTLLNVIRSERRHARHQREVPTEIVPNVVGPDSTAGQVDHVVGLSWLRVLTPLQRSVVVLRYYEDLSVAETAEILACSEGHVKRTAFEALRRLKPVLSVAGEAPSGGRKDHER